MERTTSGQQVLTNGQPEPPGTVLGMQPPNMLDQFHNLPEFRVRRDRDKCIRCLVCVR